MKRYQLGAHTKHDLKVHWVWVPKYRKKVLSGEVALRVRDLLRQIAMEHEIAIVSGKVASDHIHILVGSKPHVDVSRMVQWLKGISSRILLQEFTEGVLGAAFLGEGLLGGQHREHHRRDDPEIHC